MSTTKNISKLSGLSKLNTGLPSSFTNNLRLLGVNTRLLEIGQHPEIWELAQKRVSMCEFTTVNPITFTRETGKCKLISTTMTIKWMKQ